MACGVPTIASRTSCLPEISGNALAYFDPLSIEDMASCMYAVLCNSESSSSLRQKGIDRARDFTWQRCARETLNVLKKVAQAGNH